MSVVDDFLAVARGEIGYTEGPNNATKYGVWYGQPNVAWCAQFASWCAARVGQERAFLKHQYTPTGVKWFMDSGRWTQDPQPGDLGYVYSKSRGRVVHVFIVERVNADTVTTIEGNTNEAGDPEGKYVMRRTRTKASVYGYGRPNWKEGLTMSEAQDIKDFVQAAHDVTRGLVTKVINDYTEAASLVTRDYIAGVVREEVSKVQPSTVSRDAVIDALRELVQVYDTEHGA